jgi:sulfonate transport system substrate-binding protein
MIRRRATLLGALAAPVVLRGARAEAATLRTAQYKAGDQLLMRLAGEGQPDGYKVAWSEFGSGNLMVEAMNAAAIDVAYGSEIPPAFAAASGAAIKVIAVIRGDVNEQVLLVPQSSTAQGVVDLRGKRVGYVRATTTQFYLNRMLAEAGLTPADVQLVNLSPSDGLAAFRQGALDAWAIYGYSVPIARAEGARQLRNAAGILSGNYLMFARPAALADPALAPVLADHLRRLARAFHWMDGNHAALADAQAALLGVPRAAVLSLLDGASQPRRLVAPDSSAIASHQQVADAFIQLGLLPRGTDVARVWDRDFAARISLPA